MGNMKKISKEDVMIGDFAYTDGISSFCYGDYQEIVAFETKYDENTGAPYKVVVLKGGQKYHFDKGYCIKGPMAYSIWHYGRKAD